MAAEIWVNIGSGNGWRHQAITWTNVDLSTVRPSDIHLRASSQEIPRPSITDIIRKIKYLKFHSNFPGVNELIYWHRYNRAPCNWSNTDFPWLKWIASHEFVTNDNVTKAIDSRTELCPCFYGSTKHTINNEYINFLQGGVLYAVNDRTFNQSEWCIYWSANYAIIDLDIV